MALRAYRPPGRGDKQPHIHLRAMAQRCRCQGKASDMVPAVPDLLARRQRERPPASFGYGKLPPAAPRWKAPTHKRMSACEANTVGVRSVCSRKMGLVAQRWQLSGPIRRSHLVGQGLEAENEHPWYYEVWASETDRCRVRSTWIANQIGGRMTCCSSGGSSDLSSPFSSSLAAPRMVASQYITRPRTCSQQLGVT